MSIQLQCAECGEPLEITDDGGSIRQIIHIQVKPCQTCLEDAKENGEEEPGEADRGEMFGKKITFV